MLYVYPLKGDPIPMTQWDGNGTVSFSQTRKIFLQFENGQMVYPLSGLDWAEAYCLIQLGTGLASRYNPKADTYTWRKTPSEPLPRQIITVPGSKVREWQKLIQA